MIGTDANDGNPRTNSPLPPTKWSLSKVDTILNNSTRESSVYLFATVVFKNSSASLMCTLAVLLCAHLACSSAMGRADDETARPERVRDRLWLWTHPAGSYNDDFIKNREDKSDIEPVDAVRYMGLSNAYFIRYKDVPALPFHTYYAPFEQLQRVTWSLTGASGVTSAEERDHALGLAAKNDNIANFIMDDFYHPTCHLPLHWLAEQGAEYPVSLTVRPGRPTVADKLRLVQTRWYTEEYRSKVFAVDVSADGETFRQYASGQLPNEPAGTMDVKLPSEPFVALRIRILTAFADKNGAEMCGLSRIELRHDGQPVVTVDWSADASSTYLHHAPSNVVADPVTVPMPASLSPEQLRQLREQLVIAGRRVPLHVVLYSHQIKPRAAHHLQHVDAITLWTWVPKLLTDLEQTLERLEALNLDKQIILGCYMYDFYEKQPIPLDLMRHQTELGYRWLREGRIAGMIFLASPICDLNLEAVEWTRQWIEKTGDEILPAAEDR